MEKVLQMISKRHLAGNSSKTTGFASVAKLDMNGIAPLPWTRRQCPQGPTRCSPESVCLLATLAHGWNLKASPQDLVTSRPSFLLIVCDSLSYKHAAFIICDLFSFSSAVMVTVCCGICVFLLLTRGHLKVPCSKVSDTPMESFLWLCTEHLYICFF